MKDNDYKQNTKSSSLVTSARDTLSLRVKENGDGNNDIRAEQHDSLKPVGLTILDEVVDNEDRDKHDTGLEGIEEQVHVVASSKSTSSDQDPTDNDQQRSDEQSNLHR